VAFQVNPLIEECRSELDFYERQADRFNELLMVYHGLCSSMDLPTEDVDYSSAGMQFLLAETEALQQQFQQMVEEQYIIDSINEVMEAEMGYTLLGTRELTSQTASRLYNTGTDDDSAVNVRMTADGRITMEIVGLVDEDRDVNEADRRRLPGIMEAFCGHYPRLQHQLASRGIQLMRMGEQFPPTAAYSKIVNINNYTLVVQQDTMGISAEDSDDELSRRNPTLRIRRL